MSDRKPTRTHDTEATREALIAAGTDLFADHGFDGVRVEQIAVASGVNKALINYHFGGKAGLYAEIVRATFQGQAKAVGELMRSEAPADEKLRGFIRLIGRMVEKRPSLPRMVLREILSGGEHIDDETLPSFLAMFGAVREIVEQGMREGVFRNVDPLSTHLGLIGSLMFFFSTDRFRRERLAAANIKLPRSFKQPSTPNYIKHIEELMVRGLAAEPRRRARR